MTVPQTVFRLRRPGSASGHDRARGGMARPYTAASKARGGGLELSGRVYAGDAGFDPSLHLACPCVVNGKQTRERAGIGPISGCRWPLPVGLGSTLDAGSRHDAARCFKSASTLVLISLSFASRGRLSAGLSSPRLNRMNEKEETQIRDSSLHALLPRLCA